MLHRMNRTAPPPVPTTYEEFLRAKIVQAPDFGFAAVDESWVNPLLKPHQRATVLWAIRGGRRALFLAFGLGKSVIQIEIARILNVLTGGRFLIVMPLNVRVEFKHDAHMLATGEDDRITGEQRAELAAWQAAGPGRIPSVKFIRSVEEADPTGIYLTNYEPVRDGKLDPRKFTGASIDEAACLTAFGGSKTFREFMRLFDGMQYKFVATATPSPNEYIELLAYSAFLEVMDVSAAKTRFFKRDSTKADQLTIHPHKQKEFWLWCASWALFLQRPSDLGFDDQGYALPDLDVRWHEIPTDHKNAGHERDGQARLVRNAAIGVVDASREKRDSLPGRIAKMLELRAEDPAAHRVIWHDLEDERRAIEDVLPSIGYQRWFEHKDGNQRALELYERHYSAYQYADGRERKLFCGPGFKTVLLTEKADALFVWRKFVDDSGQHGINCAVFRNEGNQRSSDLIREAMAIAWMRWPGERLYTYVNPDKVKSAVPGWCFIRAGWKRVGVTKNGLLIFAVSGKKKVPEVNARPLFHTVYGSQDLDSRDAILTDFGQGRIPELATKPCIAGSGSNFQRHCAWEIFLGIGFKFRDFIQAIHRCYRFLQPQPVRVDIIYTEAEREVKAILQRKWEQHKQLMAEMTNIIREFGLAQASMASLLQRSIGCERIEVRGAGWRLVNNDCVLEARRMDSNSVHLVLTSIPFSTQYEYSPSFNDFGHTDSNEHFWQQMSFLTPELLRVVKPGRLAIIHVKDRIVPGGLTGPGFQTAYPFHADCIAHFQQHGFAYMGMKTIVTDVVRENNQTYRLGWTEQCKDGSKMGVGMPEYLLIFRKPPSDSTNSYADEPVVKEKPPCIADDGSIVPFSRNLPIKPGTGYSRARWQFDAHGFSRSSGDRHLKPEDLDNLDHAQIFQLFKAYSQNEVYNFEHHVLLGETLEARGILPVTFMLLQPQSWHDDVWADVTRMLTLNTSQAVKGKEQHLCPMPLDLVRRAIVQYSMPGEVVFDPFSGLGTVVYESILHGRTGYGCELSPRYHFDAVQYAKAAEQKVNMPTLFSMLEMEEEGHAVA